MYEHVLAHGRMFNEIDDEMARSVCVIGTGTRDELFGSPKELGREVIPVGETLYINGLPFTIIGMFQHYESEQERKERELAQQQPLQNARTGPSRSRGWGGQRGGFAFRLKNNTIFLPLNTMWIKLRSGGLGAGFRGGGSSSSASRAASSAALPPPPDPRLSSLEVKILDIELMNQALQQIRNVLMSTHKGIEDFSFRTQEEWAENISLFIRNARMSGGIIAGISLLVGGIGIMNIMLASISERVREIGIRKAVGANTADVFIQILVESIVIAVLGGLAGLAASYGLVHMISAFSPTDNAPIITVPAMAVAFGFSVCIGILAGLFPALKASRLHPIQALRYE
jgi:putative ABC transport system permease protein